MCLMCCHKTDWVFVMQNYGTSNAIKKVPDRKIRKIK